ncbi:hypothetical protein [Cupriavidus sp. UYPR2.512]|uniref:hypothetical protein n=1 Tax=Cupriavidus sp. UYPR2.512 TaxID=1080187 RepID=UPI00035FF11B|nr:hypothetical protein [Cupriavidus sp. UYPR2.512]UIF88228.1 hypothetical protein KAF44_20695 [Cupriavidus necator]
MQTIYLFPQGALDPIEDNDFDALRPVVVPFEDLPEASQVAWQQAATLQRSLF